MKLLFHFGDFTLSTWVQKKKRKYTFDIDVAFALPVFFLLIETTFLSLMYSTTWKHVHKRTECLLWLIRVILKKCIQADSKWTNEWMNSIKNGNIATPDVKCIHHRRSHLQLHDNNAKLKWLFPSGSNHLFYRIFAYIPNDSGEKRIVSKNLNTSIEYTKHRQWSVRS